MLEFRSMNRLAAVVITIASLASLNAGCVMEAYSEGYVAEPEVAAYYEPPPLIMIEPGIYVVRDSAVPVYYVYGYYWSYYDGIWYRARRWDAPWVRVGIHVIPYVIVHRNHHHYVYYHGQPHYRVYREPPRRVYHDRGPSRPHKVEPYRVPAKPKVTPSPVQPRFTPTPSPAPPRTLPRPRPRSIEQPSAPSRPIVEPRPRSIPTTQPAPRPVQPKAEPRRITMPKADTRRTPSPPPKRK